MAQTRYSMNPLSVECFAQYSEAALLICPAQGPGKLLCHLFHRLECRAGAGAAPWVWELGEVRLFGEQMAHPVRSSCCSGSQGPSPAGKGRHQSTALGQDLRVTFSSPFNLFFFPLRNKVCTVGFYFLSDLYIKQILSQVQIFCHFCFGGRCYRAAYGN